MIPYHSVQTNTTNNRIDAMDILRGIALLGILFMNIEWFNRPISAIMTFDYAQTGAAHITSWLTWFLVQGKFYKLFSLLFGMGFGVMLIRSQNKPNSFTWIFLRRMSILFLIGFVHMTFFWGGDILHRYALAGVLLFVLVTIFNNKYFSIVKRPRLILIAALVLFVYPIIETTYKGVTYNLKNDHLSLVSTTNKEKSINELYQDKKAKYVAEQNNSWPELSNYAQSLLNEEGESAAESLTDIQQAAKSRFERFIKIDAKIQTESHLAKTGSFTEMTEFRIKHAVRSVLGAKYMVLNMLLPMFLLGFWLISSGIMQNIHSNLNLFKALTFIALPVGLLINFFSVTIIHHPSTQTVSFLRAAAFGTLNHGQIILMLGYFGAIILLTVNKYTKGFMSIFVPVGKMALTNYILQSVVLSFIFYNYGFGLFGEVPRNEQLIILFSLFIFQIIFSTVWLRFFQYGPLEWLWRCGTHLKFFKIKKLPVSVDADPQDVINATR